MKDLAIGKRETRDIPESVRKMISAGAVLAPMSGITDLPFRLLCRQFGCGFAFTEMIDVNAIYYRNRKSFHMLDTVDQDRPLGLQLVGKDPDKIRHAAITCMKGGFDVLDLNAGCPARKVVKGGKGSALLRDPQEIARIIRMLVSEISCPVTLKIRSGWDPSSRNYIEVAEAARDAGASAICLHPRTSRQLYRGQPRMEEIRELKNAVDIPVFASGNLFSASDVASIRKTSGCDAVFIARGALGSPWIFKRLQNPDLTAPYEDIPFAELKGVILRHVLLNVSYYGQEHGIRRMYKHICWYLKRFKGLDIVMKEFRKASGTEGVRCFLERLTLDNGRYLFL